VIKEVQQSKFVVRGSYSISKPRSFDRRFNTKKEAEAWINGIDFADNDGQFSNLDLVEIRRMRAVIGIHTHSEGEDVSTHGSEEEALEYLEELKNDNDYDTERDEFKWHTVTLEMEVQHEYEL
jgi:hypothetical protein